MIPRSIFYDRRDNYCLKCEFWKGRCLKKHALTSPQGCPIKKFPPIQNAGYSPDIEVEPAKPPSGECCGKGGDPDLKPMSWADAAKHLAAAMAQWVRDGCPLTTDEIYQERVGTCQDGCPHFRWFQCRLCKCPIFTKAKVPTEKCDAGRWRR